MLKEEFDSSGNLVHYAVLALIEDNGKYFLVERETLPSGYALVTGHVEDGESEEEALIREVKEETGLNILKFQLIFKDKIDNSECNKNANVHKSFVFKCDVGGKVKLNKKENKKYGWFSKEEIRKLGLGPYWERVLKQIEIL